MVILLSIRGSTQLQVGWFISPMVRLANNVVRNYAEYEGEEAEEAEND